MKVDRSKMERQLQHIRHLLSHLQGELTELELNSKFFESSLILRTGQKRVLTDLDEKNSNTLLPSQPAFFALARQFLSDCEWEPLGMIVFELDQIENHKKEYLSVVGEMLKQYSSPNLCMGHVTETRLALVVRGQMPEVLALAEFIRRGIKRLQGRLVEKMPGKAFTISLGAASRSLIQKESFEKLLAQAEQALLEAKRQGKDQVRVF